MNNEQKGQLYSQLMREFDVLRNKIADIKITQVNLTAEQEKQVKMLESQQQMILRKVNQLLG